jgi:hypothetical protein
VVDLLADDGERLVELELDLAAVVQHHLDLERASFHLAVADPALARVRQRSLGGAVEVVTGDRCATPADAPSPITAAADAATMNAVLRFMSFSSHAVAGRSRSAGA